MSKHLLFFSHAYLPENTSAVQRSAPLARYLADEAEMKMCVALAKDVHKALEKLSGKKVPFPRDYTAAKRAELMKAW